MNARTTERFGQLLFWAILAAAGCFLAFLGAGLISGDLGTLYSAVPVGIYAGVLIYARRLGAAGRLGAASLLVSVTLVVVALVLAALQPLLWVDYALVPLLAAAVLLQFAPRIPITPALLACGLTTAMIAAVGELLTPLVQRPEPLVQILRVSSLSITAGFILFLLWQFRVRLHASLDEVSSINAQLSAKNIALEQHNETLAKQIARSEQLVAQVTALETPVTTLNEGVLFAPLVGHLSSERTAALQGRLLESVQRARAGWVLVDMQGVPRMDTRVAGELIAAFQAVKLLGTRVCLCGITAPVATVLTQLGISFEGVLTARSPQEAFLLISAEQAAGPRAAAHLVGANGHARI